MNNLNYETILNNIRKQLKKQITDNHLKSLILGISGGIDSALVAAIAKPICDELNIPLIGRSITISTNKQDEILRAKMIGESFCTNFREINLSYDFDVIKWIDNDNIENITDNNDFSTKIRMGNIKARLRMIYLYNLASKYKGIVLGTENLTEKYLGFFTICGDEASDFEPIQELWKTEVYELSEWMVQNDLKTDQEKVALQSCIDAVATDGLGITNSDLDQILPNFKGSSRDGYKKVDEFLKGFLNGTYNDFTNPVIQRHINSNFKRNRPIVVKRDLLF